MSYRRPQVFSLPTPRAAMLAFSYQKFVLCDRIFSGSTFYFRLYNLLKSFHPSFCSFQPKTIFTSLLFFFCLLCHLCLLFLSHHLSHVWNIYSQRLVELQGASETCSFRLPILQKKNQVQRSKMISWFRVQWGLPLTITISFLLK